MGAWSPYYKVRRTFNSRTSGHYPIAFRYTGEEHAYETEDVTAAPKRISSGVEEVTRRAITLPISSHIRVIKSLPRFPCESQPRVGRKDMMRFLNGKDDGERRKGTTEGTGPTLMA